MLDREPILSLRRLARSLNMTPPRLCQLFNLLKLSPAVRRAIAVLPMAVGRARVTEYGLRRISALAPAAQIEAFRRIGRERFA